MSGILIAGADIETTGLVPGEDRIIEVYVGFWRSDAPDKRVGEYFQRINPQRSIAAAAQAVHKISLPELAGEPTWDTVASTVRKVLEKADLVVGHNFEQFDKRFIDEELKRERLAATTKPIFDTMLAGRWATCQGKVPTLGELCFACDIPYDPSKAHAARYDVEVMMQSFFRGAGWGFFDYQEKLSGALAA